MRDLTCSSIQLSVWIFNPCIAMQVLCPCNRFKGARWMLVSYELFWNSLEIRIKYSNLLDSSKSSPFGKEYQCMHLFYQCMHLFYLCIYLLYRCMPLFYQCIYLSIALCRTARGDNQGSALSFVSVKDMDLLVEVEKTLSESGSEYTHHNEHRVKHCLHSSQHRIRQWVQSSP